MDLGLNGRTAAVAAGTAGLGLGTAKALASEGVRVVVCGRDEQRLATALADIGHGAKGFVCDVSDAEGGRAFVEQALANGHTLTLFHRGRSGTELFPGVERVIGDPFDARQRADLLADLRSSGELAAVQAVVTRAARLAEKGDLEASVLAPAEVVDAALFEKSSEAGMLAVLAQLEPIATGSSPDRYAALARGLSAGAEALAAFFDGDQSVMVMADDPAVRRNRLNLLAVLRNQASVLADFSRISG